MGVLKTGRHVFTIGVLQRVDCSRLQGRRAWHSVLWVNHMNCCNPPLFGRHSLTDWWLQFCREHEKVSALTRFTLQSVNFCSDCVSDLLYCSKNLMKKSRNVSFLHSSPALDSRGKFFEVTFTSEPHHTFAWDWNLLQCTCRVDSAVVSRPGFCWSRGSIDRFHSCLFPILDQRWPVALPKVVAVIHPRLVSCPGFSLLKSNQTLLSERFTLCHRKHRSAEVGFLDLLPFVSTLEQLRVY